MNRTLMCAVLVACLAGSAPAEEETRTPKQELEALLAPIVEDYGLRLHSDRIDGRLHDHAVPDVRITVFGADRAGIVAQVTGVLAEAGLNILDLESDVGGSADAPIYIMHIEGIAGQGIDPLRAALVGMAAEGVDTRIESIETLIG